MIRQFGLSFRSNIQHFRKQIGRNIAKVYQRLLRLIRSVPFVLVDISVLEKSVHNAEPLAATKLRKYVLFSLNAQSLYLPMKLLNVSLSVPMLALKSPQNITDSFKLTL